MLAFQRALRAAAALAAAVAATATLIATPAQAAPPPAAPGWSLVWAEDFTAPAGSAPDPTRWAHLVGGGGWGGGALEYNTPGAANTATDGKGNLVITARTRGAKAYSCWYGPCRYTSGRIHTGERFGVRYGHVEARIKIPTGQGLVPAFWLIGENYASVGWPASGEIDVLENVGRQPGTMHSSLHGPGYSGSDPLTSSVTLPGGAKLSEAFHTYSVDWTPEAVTFALDGRPFKTWTPADAGKNAWVFDEPFYLVLNLSVGLAFGGQPDATTPMPARMKVDYVAAYKRDAGAGAQRSAFTRLEAESYDAQAGVRTFSDGDEARVSDGGWLLFDDVDFGAGATGTRFGFSSGAPTTGVVEIRLDQRSAPPVAAVPVSATGGWDAGATASAALAGVTGRHRVYLSFSSATAGDVELDWLTFDPALLPASPLAWLEGR